MGHIFIFLTVIFRRYFKKAQDKQSIQGIAILCFFVSIRYGKCRAKACHKNKYMAHWPLPVLKYRREIKVEEKGIGRCRGCRVLAPNILLFYYVTVFETDDFVTVGCRLF